MKEPPYGIPMPPPGAANPMSLNAPPVRPRAVQKEVVRAPRPGETGALAGIDIPALRELISMKNGKTEPVSMPIPKPVVPNEAFSRHARRLYVGNLPVDTMEVQVESFFNRALQAAKGVEMPGNPVLSVYLNRDKRFAFVEIRTAKEAAAVLALDGVKFRDLSLRVRRPNDYIGSEEQPPVGFNPSVLGIVSTQVSDGPNKVFIGGLPYTLTEDQIKNLLVSYGQLRAFNLIKEPNSGLSKGFAFFEFEDEAAVDKCCEGMHGMKIDNKKLTVRRASHTGTHASGAKMTDLDLYELIREQSCVVEVRNMGLDNVEGEVADEAKRFGKVEQVRQVQDSVYVKWSCEEEAQRGEACLHGRVFDGRLVTAKLVRQDVMDQVLQQAVK